MPTLNQFLDKLVLNSQKIVGRSPLNSRGVVRRSAPQNFATYQSLEPRKMLAVLTVTTATDSTTAADLNDGLVSLREAITAANTNSAFGDAAAGDVSGDSIRFDADLNGEIITLGGSELEITDDLIIRGGISDIIISGDAASRIFRVNTDETVVLSKLALQLGMSDEGGALLAEGGGTVRLFETTFTSNLAIGEQSGEGNGGAVSNQGSRLLITDSIFENNRSFNSDGGAIYSSGGSINFLGSTLSNNSALNGGGFAAEDGQYFFNNTTIEQNEADQSGGGLLFTGTDSTALFLASIIDQNSAPGGNGGGIALEDGRVSAFGNTVISGNRAISEGSFNFGGGIYSQGGDVRIGGSEITGNSSGGARRRNFY